VSAESLDRVNPTGAWILRNLDLRCRRLAPRWIGCDRRLA